MFSREEKHRHTMRFWQEFSQFCDNRGSESYIENGWILYDTKIKGVDLKFDITREYCDVAIEINSKSESRRLDIYEEVETFKAILDSGFPESPIWDFNFLRDNGVEVCRVYSRLEDVDIHRESNWRDMFNFMSTYMEILQSNFIDIQDILRIKLKDKKLI